MVNKVVLIGRLGQPPKETKTQNGNTVCTFSIATESGFGDNKRTDWHNIVTFGKTAEICAKYLSKGSQVFVMGRITYDEYEKDGQKRTRTQIVAQEVQFIGKRPDNQQQTQADDTNPFVPEYSQVPPGNSFEDVPF